MGSYAAGHVSVPQLSPEARVAARPRRSGRRPRSAAVGPKWYQASWTRCGRRLRIARGRGDEGGVRAAHVRAAPAPADRGPRHRAVGRHPPCAIVPRARPGGRPSPPSAPAVARDGNTCVVGVGRRRVHRSPVGSNELKGRPNL